jgi:hypothetical protein
MLDQGQDQVQVNDWIKENLKEADDLLQWAINTHQKSKNNICKQNFIYYHTKLNNHIHTTKQH